MPFCPETLSFAQFSCSMHVSHLPALPEKNNQLLPYDSALFFRDTTNNQKKAHFLSYFCLFSSPSFPPGLHSRAWKGAWGGGDCGGCLPHSPGSRRLPSRPGAAFFPHGHGCRLLPSRPGLGRDAGHPRSCRRVSRGMEAEPRGRPAAVRAVRPEAGL